MIERHLFMIPSEVMKIEPHELEIAKLLGVDTALATVEPSSEPEAL